MREAPRESAALPAGLRANQADSGALTLIQRRGSAANLNIHLHWPAYMVSLRSASTRLSLKRDEFHGDWNYTLLPKRQ